MGTLSKTSQPFVAMANGSHWDDPSNAHPTLNQSFNTGAIGYSDQELFSQRGAGLVADHAAADDEGVSVVSPPAITDADKGHQDPVVCSTIASTLVRRLTPTECERLQGFPDGYTDIPVPTTRRAQKKRETDEEYAAYVASVPEKRAADGPRYKALGNSMAVPVMRWIGERIDAFEERSRATEVDMVSTTVTGSGGPRRATG